MINLKAKVKASLEKDFKIWDEILVLDLPKVIIPFFESILRGLLFHFKVKAIKLTVPCNKLINKNRLTKWYGALPSCSSFRSHLVHCCFSLGDWWKVLFKFRLNKVLSKTFQNPKRVVCGREGKKNGLCAPPSPPVMLWHVSSFVEYGYQVNTSNGLAPSRAEKATQKWIHLTSAISCASVNSKTDLPC